MSLNAISLCAGIGGIDLALMKSGFEIGLANDFCPKSCQTYSKNFKNKIICKDIEDLDMSLFPKSNIVAAGFPCQPFSIAGKMKGFFDTRGTIFFKIMETVDSVKPDVIFLENVKNIVTHDNGVTFSVIKKEIEDRGYSFNFKVMNTALYGNIPQNRERVYIVAIKGGERFDFPDQIPLIKKIEDVFENEVSEKYYYSDKSIIFNHLTESVKDQKKIYQWRRKYVRENKKGLSPTLTANMGTGGHNVPIIKDSKGIRKLTPRECFNLQGFDKSFILPDIADSHLYKQAGNSVSVPVVERIAKKIAEKLKNR